MLAVYWLFSWFGFSIEGSNSFGKGFLDLSSGAHGSVERFVDGVVAGVVGGVPTG